LHPVSKTFHGRDVFAAVGGMAFEELAAWQHGAKRSRTSSDCPWPRPKEADGLLKGVVLKVDSFGKLDYEFPGRGFCRPGAIEKGQINLQAGQPRGEQARADVSLTEVAGEAIAVRWIERKIWRIGVNQGKRLEDAGLGKRDAGFVEQGIEAPVPPAAGEPYTPLPQLSAVFRRAVIWGAGFGDRASGARHHRVN